YSNARHPWSPFGRRRIRPQSGAVGCYVLNAPELSSASFRDTRDESPPHRRAHSPSTRTAYQSCPGERSDGWFDGPSLALRVGVSRLTRSASEGFSNRPPSHWRRTLSARAGSSTNDTWSFLPTGQ